MILGIYCNTFCKQISSFSKFIVKTSCTKTKWYKLQLQLQASCCSSYQNLLWQKFDISRNTSSKNSDQIKIILTIMFNTKYSFVLNWTEGRRVKLQILGKRSPQVHLIFVKEWPTHPSPLSPTHRHTHILRNFDNFPTGAFYLTPNTIRQKRVL